MAEGVLAEIVNRKRHDIRSRLHGVTLDPKPTRRSLRAALARPGARFIMEVKRASPSGHCSDVAVADAVAAYAPVADAISVLTDEPFFSGSLDDLRAARAGFDGPILAKDFIIDPRQVAEARLHGADAVLVILAVLDDEEATAVMAEARRLGMDVIVEAHDEAEVRRAVALGASIIGINNRNLKTLKTDLAVTERLASLVPDDVILISESGVRIRADVDRLGNKVDAFLVGSSLMASDDIAEAARALVHGRVKLCGLTRREDVALAVRCGATHAGFVFVPGTPRAIGQDQARDLTAFARRSGLKAVGVFRDAAEQDILTAVEQIGLDAVQLHGREPSEFTSVLRSRMPQRTELWGVCGVGAAASPGRPGIDRTMFDTIAGRRSGGTGQPFDWKLVQDREDLPSAFLAGGIGPHNAAKAAKVGAYGLDVGSAVESHPGAKDADKVAALFAALRPGSRARP